MKRSRYREEQIIGILKEQEAGVPVAELCRKHGMSDATFYNWKSKYGWQTPLGFAARWQGPSARRATAIEMIEKYLSEPLKQLESLGYTRTEFACSYLLLAHHACHFNQSDAKADKSFAILSHFAKQRIERNLKFLDHSCFLDRSVIGLSAG